MIELKLFSGFGLLRLYYASGLLPENKLAFCFMWEQDQNFEYLEQKAADELLLGTSLRPINIKGLFVTEFFHSSAAKRNGEIVHYLFEKLIREQILMALARKMLSSEAEAIL